MSANTATSSQPSAIGKLLDMLIKHGTTPNVPVPDLIRDAQVELASFEIELTALRAVEQILHDVQAGNYDNAHDITAARKYIYRRLQEIETQKGKQP